MIHPRTALVLATVLVAYFLGVAATSAGDNHATQEAMISMASDIAQIREDVHIQAVGLVPGTACDVTLNASTATKIVCGTGQRAYECTVDSAETDTAYIGAKQVTSSLYRRTATGGDKFGANLKFEYGISSSGNITLHCSTAIQ